MSFPTNEIGRSLLVVLQYVRFELPLYRKETHTQKNIGHGSLLSFKRLKIIGFSFIDLVILY